MSKNNFHAEAVIEKSMMALGLSLEMKTEVSLVRKILCEINLDDFDTSYLPMEQFFKDIVSEPQDLSHFISNIKLGLVIRCPSVVEFAELALEKRWFAPSEYNIKAINIAFILESVTAAMCNSYLFFTEYVEHIRSKEKDIGIDRQHVLKSFFKTFPGSLNFFGSAKAVSIDMAMVYFRVKHELRGEDVTPESLDLLYKNNKISFLERKLLSPLCNRDYCVCNDWLRINIYEAGVTEYKNQYKSNAIAAHVLSEDVFRHCHPEKYELKPVYPKGKIDPFYYSLAGRNNYFPVVDLSEEWVSLYLSWNMAFILGELNNLHYLFPKLLIPSLLCSESDNFIGVRIISLWISVNSSLFLNFNNIEKITGPSHRKEMAVAWGEINQRYAQILFKDHMNSDIAVLKKNFKERFSHPYRSLFKQITNFLTRT